MAHSQKSIRVTGEKKCGHLFFPEFWKRKHPKKRTSLQVVVTDRQTQTNWGISKMCSLWGRSGKCQSSILISFMEFESQNLVRYMHVEVILWGVGSAPLGPKEQLLILMPFHRPVQLSRYLLHIETVLGDTANALVMAHMNVLPWESWAISAGAASTCLFSWACFIITLDLHNIIITGYQLIPIWLCDDKTTEPAQLLHHACL